MFTTATFLARRLSEVEKSQIRSAGVDRLHYLFFSRYCHEIALPKDEGYKMFQEVQNIVNADFTATSQSDQFGRTWLF